jgi:phosphonate transport system substrate-binding protein
MKKLALALVATTALTGTAMAQDAITEFNIGILGGENAQDRLASTECLRVKTEEFLSLTRIVGSYGEPAWGAT